MDHTARDKKNPELREGVDARSVNIFKGNVHLVLDPRKMRAATRQTPLSEALVGLGRVELPTSPLSGVRSNLLSYRPIKLNDAILMPCS